MIGAQHVINRRFPGMKSRSVRRLAGRSEEKSRCRRLGCARLVCVDPQIQWISTPDSGRGLFGTDQEGIDGGAEQIRSVGSRNAGLEEAVGQVPANTGHKRPRMRGPNRSFESRNIRLTPTGASGKLGRRITKPNQFLALVGGNTLCLHRSRDSEAFTPRTLLTRLEFANRAAHGNLERYDAAEHRINKLRGRI